MATTAGSVRCSFSQSPSTSTSARATITPLLRSGGWWTDRSYGSSRRPTAKGWCSPGPAKVRVAGPGGSAAPAVAVAGGALGVGGPAALAVPQVALVGGVLAAGGGGAGRVAGLHDPVLGGLGHVGQGVDEPEEDSAA